jgi:hypothetical protein
MAQNRIPGKGRVGARALLVSSASAAAAIALAAPLFAQSLGLRTAADPSPQSRTPFGEIAAASVYQPISPGALPDDPLSSSDGTARSSSIFDEDPADGNPFAAPLPLRSGTQTQQGPSQAASANGRPAASASAEQRRAGDDTDADTITGSLPAQRQAQFNIDLAATQERNERATAIEARRRTYEESPFAPVGLRAGRFLLFPSLEQGLTYTNNADSSTDGEPALLSETTLRLSASSDWARHSAFLSGFGTIRRSLHGEDVEDFFGGLNSGLQLDLANAYTLNATANYLITPESATSPVVIEGTLDEPIRQTFDGSIGLSKAFGALQLTGTARLEREVYGDADLSTGGTVSQKDRNSTLAAFVLRTGWELSPALTPFVETEIGRRFYDNEVDTAGYERSALRTGIRAGLEIDFAEKLTGEFSAGWLAENFSDDRLSSLSGASFDADLIWSPLRGTTVALNGNTTLEGTTTAGDSGSVLYSAALSATREMRANLSATASVGFGWRDFKDIDGHELIWNTEASMTYWFNRYAGLIGRARFEQVTSDLPFRDSETASIFVGVKLQR